MNSKQYKSNRYDGKIIYHSKEIKSHRTENDVSICEKIVIHRETGLYVKYFEKTKKNEIKYEIKSFGKGEYELITIKDKNKTREKYTKEALIKFLKKISELKFIIEYLVSSKDLSRSRKIK